MDYPLTGYHHITACAGGAQQDVNFFTQTVGLRMAKQTVLMDGKIPIYHLYYSNAKIEPGSVMTTFPYSRLQGRRGSGQVHATAFTVAKGTLPFWKEHLKRHKMEQQPMAERFGQSFIRFSHPAGLDFEVIEDKDDQREGWSTPEIKSSEAARGFHGAVLSVREVPETERFFTEALGFRKTGVDGNYHRFETGAGGANKTVTLLHEPDRPAGSWTFGAGTVHHIALWGADDDALTRQKAIYEELGYTDASEIKDRFYFHSMYCRCPGGILVESCCNVPGGFEKDETRNELGTKLHLPPWWADRTSEIMASLEPIRVPETATAH
ncbi:MAG TPA: VOC family protein [Bryobacteraceae bacterium]|jgi:glyoxalase family protein|nr:VOC family protein [Bryobacteraceae bacterium]